MNTDRTVAMVMAMALACTACGSSATTTATSISTGSTAATPSTSESITSEPATTVVPTTGSPTTAAPTTAAPTTTAAPAAPATMRGARYCEVLLLRPIDGEPSAEVYNTYPLNECPDAAWKALDPAAIAEAAGVPLAILNGPRYWLMDSIGASNGAAPAPVSFGGIDMIQRATVNLGAVGAGEPPYTPHNVDRKAVFSYAAGSTVYELVASDGTTYVMQSWSQQVDPTLDEAALAQLAARLQLPSGWTYRVRVLDEPLQVDTTDTDAVVLQDELRNSYSMETDASS